MTIDYATVKHLHTTAATLSIAFFLTRGAWMLWAPAMLQVRWVRIAPHVVDTILLVAGLWLASQLAPGGPHAWLAAKVVALLVYIALGVVALKRRARSRCASPRWSPRSRPSATSSASR